MFFKIFLNIILIIASGIFFDYTFLFAEDSISRGKDLYMRTCTMCHGRDGNGNTSIAKAMKTIPNFTERSMNDKSDQELFNIITTGKSQMPPYKNLSEKDRWNLVYFIRTFAPKENE